MLHGECLCGAVAFEIGGRTPTLYQCHCALCRKQSGAGASVATIVSKDSFRWLRGESNISSWIKDTGFRSDFCATCGAPVPNPLRAFPYVWVPVGLLDDAPGLAIGLQVFMRSKAAWDTVVGPGIAYEAAPDLQEFIRLLHSEPTG